MKQSVFSLLFVLLTMISLAQDMALRKKHFNLDGGLALSGYDAVAYLNQSKAVKGTKNFAVTQDGVTYYFSTMANSFKSVVTVCRLEPIRWAISSWVR